MASGLQSVSQLPIFSCTVCQEHCPPPLKSCTQADGYRHQTCLECFEGLIEKVCPHCRAPFGARRFSLDDVALGVLFSCRNASSGCDLRVTGNEMYLHQQICSYRPYQCVYIGCCFVDFEILHHMEVDHGIIPQTESRIVFVASEIFSATGLGLWITLQTVYGCSFLTVLERRDVSYY